MDIAPEDKGENIRREICLTLEQMGIYPESSHHEEGPGQNEIDFRYSDPLTAADNAMTFQTVVKTIARRNGLFADFTPKPLKDHPGNGFHINVSVNASDKEDHMDQIIAGILEKVSDMTVFFKPDRKTLINALEPIRLRYIFPGPMKIGHNLSVFRPLLKKYRRMELRSPDPTTNAYLAFALIIYACMEGMQKKN